MDLSLSPEQAALADSVRRFAERDYSFDARRAIIDSPAGISEAHWATFASLGWLGAGLAEDAGGFGGGAVENAVIAEELGRALVVEPFAATVLALQLLAGLAVAPDLVEAIVMGGTRAVLAHHEADGRGDARFVETTARRIDGEWRLDGAKSLVMGAPQAAHLLVSARLDGRIALFRLASDAPGLLSTPYRTVDNGRVADLALDGVPAVLLADDAAAAIEAAIDHATVILCAEAVGAMDRALWMTRDYARTRQQFGRTIGSFQAYQHRMADMLIEYELARSMLLQGLAALDGPVAQRAAGVSAAKVAVGEAGLFVGRQAIQLHGGIGMTEEYAVGHYYRRLFAIAHLLGNADHHVERFADQALAA